MEPVPHIDPGQASPIEFRTGDSAFAPRPLLLAGSGRLNLGCGWHRARPDVRDHDRARRPHRLSADQHARPPSRGGRSLPLQGEHRPEGSHRVCSLGGFRRTDCLRLGSLDDVSDLLVHWNCTRCHGLPDKGLAAASRATRSVSKKGVKVKDPRSLSECKESCK